MWLVVCEQSWWVCGAHSCPCSASLLLFLLPWSWHWYEYPEDDVTTSTASQTAVQSQAQFPQRPVKHQNNLLSNCACACGFLGVLLAIHSHTRAIQNCLNFNHLVLLEILCLFWDMILKSICILQLWSYKHVKLAPAPERFIHLWSKSHL